MSQTHGPCPCGLASAVGEFGFATFTHRPTFLTVGRLASPNLDGPNLAPLFVTGLVRSRLRANCSCPSVACGLRRQSRDRR